MGLVQGGCLAELIAHPSMFSEIYKMMPRNMKVRENFQKIVDR
jgi:hypothetical protein